MTTITDTTTPTFTWEPGDIALAVNHRRLFLQKGDLKPDQLASLQQLPSRIRRAARTIAEVSTPSAMMVPDGVGDFTRLPAADAVLVQSSREAWWNYSAEGAFRVATDHLADLDRLYDVDAVLSGSQEPQVQLICRAVLHPAEAHAVARRVARLLKDGKGESNFADALAELMERHTWREVMAEASIDDIVSWRRRLDLHPDDLAQAGEIEPARLRAMEAGTVQPERVEARRLADAISTKRRETTAQV